MDDVKANNKSSPRKLRKLPQESMIGGVCSGVAYWLGVPVWIVRLVWVISALFMGFGFGLYILLWIFLPTWDETPLDFKEVTGD